MAYIPEEREEERLGGAQADREWLVEYIVEFPDENPTRMVTILRGAQMADVQGRLYDILRAQYASEARLDVTVVRMEPVDMRTGFSSGNSTIYSTSHSRSTCAPPRRSSSLSSGMYAITVLFTLRDYECFAATRLNRKTRV